MSPTLSKRINGKLASLTPTAPGCCIFKLHRHLRNVNDKAYEPLMLAIGPYNHGKDGLGLMEEHKWRYLQQKLQRRNEQSLDTYIMALRELEESARKCYAECISQTKDEFVEMMLLDGCFIIELLCKSCGKVRKEGRDPIFDMDWMFDSIVRDLLLFENQLPFFVLTKLFEMSEFGGDSIELVRLAIGFLSSQSLFGQTINGPSKEAMVGKYVNGAVHILQNRNSATHLLDLMHSGISFSVLNMEKNHARVRQEAGVKFKKLSETFKHLSDSICKAANLVGFTKLSKGAEIGDDWTLIHSAIELHEAGVKFHKAEQGNIFGIKFNNGVLDVSPLTIDDNTETNLRNLIAFEQYSQDKDSHYATDYMCFLDDLINSPKDVEFLRRRGIIKNLLGDDEVTSTMVNKLGHNVHLPSRSPIYAKITDDLKKHCSRRRNVWMAKLRHDYFNGPWSLLSFLAAVFLILLAITQTTFTMIN
ncbi:hypothetical protein F2P56_014974 [Juglans regia]|uniref:Uncharacterized protein n=2 Tax=Juglans regia TaxID=51240 RepID=A0A833XEV1_JUGRE|nr:UPF0481 protein At3g47200-like [Juglans regia]KAF5464937.1 hypothetical protein F2P56_014974 [Juglans regia]